MGGWETGDRRARVRATTLMFVSGGLLVVATVLGPQPEAVNRPGILFVGAAAALAAIGVTFLGPRHTVGVSHLFAATGTTLVAVAVAMGGGTYLSVVYAIFFVWVAQYAAVFFRPTAVVAHVVYVAAAHGVALTRLPPGDRLILWVVTVGTCAVVVYCYALFRRASARHRGLIEHAGGVVFIVSRDGSVQFQGGPIEHLLGYSPDGLLGTSPQELVHPDEADRIHGVLSAVLERPDTSETFEWRLRHRDGHWIHAEVRVENGLDDPAVDGVVLTVRDVTERRELEEQLVHQAFHDPLTGLANRSLFADRVEHAVARRTSLERRVAVLFIDLDEFKSVNDSLGHHAGDGLLAAVGERLAAQLRPGDTIARIGGDEFAVLIEDAAESQAARVADRLLGGLTEPFVLPQGEVFISASIGTATSADVDMSADELLREADLAMFQAKQHGKGRHERFHPEMQQRMVRHLRLQTDLQRALDRGELHVAYQPTVDLRDGRVLGVEALARWNHPHLGSVPPNEFIAIAEQNGLIGPIGRWVLETACHQGSRWAGHGVDLDIHVNVSARQLETDELLGDVCAALAASGLPAARLVLEVTESVLVDDLDLTVRRLERLRRLGVKIAIDDFGTGYSSLGYLDRLPVDVLKIDRSFVEAIADGAQEATLIRSIIEVARTLGLETVAEGVEHEGQAARLRAAGCRTAQGYLYGRPMDASGVTQLLAKHLTGHLVGQGS